ncbi:hypothetical protein JD844_003872, partial [Phrynosoma platyrhinos]
FCVGQEGPVAPMAVSQEHYGDYHRLPDYEDDSLHEDEEELLVHVTEGLKDSWHHIKNLDNFFTKISFMVVIFLFVVAFTTFLLCCVEYDVLFANRPINHTHQGGGLTPDRSKVTLPDAILPTPQCAQRIQASSWIIFLLVMAATFWLYRLVKVFCSLLGYWEIRTFYTKALKIPSEELCNCSWQEVQARLISLQREQQMCVHKRELSELDIHHRILRFKNYLVAMVNKALLPVRFRLPLLGEGVFLTQGLKYNLELLFFWGPGSLFQGKWNLQPQYKRAGARLELARRLGRSMVLLGLANLLLCPFILVWQVLYAFFSYTEVLKREPGSLGARRWSLYGRLYLRHFNELDHELQARLSRGYKPASKYMNSFTSPLLTLLAKNLAFFAGSILAVLIALTVYDEDVLTVQHILTAITLLGLIVTVARSFIPDEHLVWCPEQLLQSLLAHIHYIPDHWQGNAHKSETREELSQLFQYKAVNGDLLAQSELPWLSQGQTEASVYQQAENGKTELSLVHFAIANPRWQPPPESSLFIGHLKEKVQQDAAHAPSAQRLLAEAPLAASLLSDEGPSTMPDALLASVLAHPVLSAASLASHTEQQLFTQPGSMAGAAASILASLSCSQLPRRSCPLGDNSIYHSDSSLLWGRQVGTRVMRGTKHYLLFLAHSVAPPETRQGPLARSVVLSEFASAEMSLHAIYMHELRHQHQQQRPQEVLSLHALSQHSAQAGQSPGRRHETTPSDPDSPLGQHQQGTPRGKAAASSP